MNLQQLLNELYYLIQERRTACEKHLIATLIYI